MSDTTKPTFFTVEAFKKAINTNTITILEDSVKGTKWFNDDAGNSYKAQAVLDVTLPMCFILEGTDLNDACLINYKANENVNTLATI